MQRTFRERDPGTPGRRYCGMKCRSKHRRSQRGEKTWGCTRLRSEGSRASRACGRGRQRDPWGGDVARSRRRGDIFQNRRFYIFRPVREIIRKKTKQFRQYQKFPFHRCSACVFVESLYVG